MSTGIQWCDDTWNPVVGCDRVSPGCAHCYAKTKHDQRHKAYLAGKLQNIPQYAHPFEVVQLKPERLMDPLRWRRGRRVFVNSVSDLFHDDVPFEFIDRVFAVMALARRHTFQVLTKRPARMFDYFDKHYTRHKVAAAAVEFSGKKDGALGTCDHDVCNAPFPLPNVWLGVSVENQRFADERIPLLMETPAAVRFLSCEPLLGHLELDFDDIAWRDGEGRYLDWVIVGGESGKDARLCDLDDVTDVVAQCDLAGVACFVKQLGAVPMVGCERLALRDSHGGDMAEWHPELRVREFPASGVRA